MIRVVILALLFSTLSAEERFPVPTEEEVMQAREEVEWQGAWEIFSLSYDELITFCFERCFFGLLEPFRLFNCNPSKIDPALPAILLLHAFDSNQGEWIPLLSTLSQSGNFQVFSLNYRYETAMEALTEKIESIRSLYFAAGAESVTLHLIGHSLGGIIASEYSFDESLWVPHTTVEKVITIASRLQNIERPVELPYYAYCYPILQRIDLLAEKLQARKVKLYTIAAENDWLLPLECSLAGDECAVIPSCGHILVTQSPMTHAQVVEWITKSL